jgi:peptide/nickel transport system permease protein
MNVIPNVLVNNRKIRLGINSAVFAALLLSLIIAALLIPSGRHNPDFMSKNLPPSWAHLFGTDWLGRDMLSRSIKGIVTSMEIGFAATLVSSVISILLGTMAALLGKKVDNAILWLIDLFLGIPHLVFILFISFAAGRGVKGVMIGVILTHWPTLARIIRAEILSLKEQPYIKLSRKLGRSNFYIAKEHMIVHVFPQFIVGLVLLFPHAILHEASITFLGFGIPAEIPAIGVILSESMKYITMGMWWLAVFPGLLLLSVVLMIDTIGNNLQKLLDPATSQL